MLNHMHINFLLSFCNSFLYKELCNSPEECAIYVTSSVSNIGLVILQAANTQGSFCSTEEFTKMQISVRCT